MRRRYLFPPPTIAPDRARPRRTSRRGVGPAEVLVVVLVLGFLALLLMIGLTRSREVARSATCSRNLQQIGIALELYEQATRMLPRLAPLDGMGDPAASPLLLMLDQFGVEDLAGLDPQAPAPPAAPGAEPKMERYVPGFVCPSDPIATSRVLPAPVNYRANTGDRVDGRRGPFEPGASVSFADVEAGHGSSYTAGFAERLVGTAGASNERARDYRVVPGRVPDDGCPDAPDAPLRTDAGRSWLELGWRSTLYTHAAPPGAARSCIAEDGGSALMGASSGHVEGIRVLMMDGSVRVYTTTIAPPVWAALGSFTDDGAPAAPTPSPTPDEPDGLPEGARTAARSGAGP